MWLAELETNEFTRAGNDRWRFLVTSSTVIDGDSYPAHRVAAVFAMNRADHLRYLSPSARCVQ